MARSDKPDEIGNALDFVEHDPFGCILWSFSEGRLKQLKAGGPCHGSAEANRERSNNSGCQIRTLGGHSGLGQIWDRSGQDLAN